MVASGILYPQELPFAPRPVNGEVLSSWAMRLASANSISITELNSWIRARLGKENLGQIFNYRGSKEWRDGMAALARVPESWVWVLDLQQHFPASNREWFLHSPYTPDTIRCHFCPECLAEQVENRLPPHLKVEWALATTTRCFKHQLPLYRVCPWCGRSPTIVLSKGQARCGDCDRNLGVRPRYRYEPV